MTQSDRSDADPGETQNSVASLATRKRSWWGRSARLRTRVRNPFSDPATFWRIVSQVATTAMGVILFGAFLWVARSLIVPLIAALVVSMTLGPLAAAGARRGVPSWVPAIVIVSLLFAGVYVAVSLLTEPLTRLIARAPEIGTIIKERLQFLDRPLAAIRELQGAMTGKGSGLQVAVDESDVLQSVVAFATPAALEFVLFLAMLFFLVFGRDALRRYFVNLFPSRDARLRALRILNDTEEDLSRYLVVVTVINICVGLIVTFVALLMGLPSPLLLGATAFVLNYIPYIGPGIMHITLFVLGLLTFPTLLPALIAPLFFLAFTFVEGHFITPAVVGRQMYQHPLAVFMSLAFWTWLWGPAGAFLATPILIMATVAMDHLYPRSKQALPE